MIFCIIGKTGAGKSTIAKEVSRTLDIPIIVSYTSRPKRINEKNGIDYNYVDNEYFKKYYKDFIDLREYTVATGEVWRYGIRKNQIQKRKDYIVVVDIQGFNNLSKHFETKAIFIDSHDTVILQRLEERGDSKAEIIRRLEDDKRRLTEFMDALPIENRIIVYNNDNITSAIDDCAASIIMTKINLSYKKTKMHSFVAIFVGVLVLLCYICELFILLSDK